MADIQVRIESIKEGETPICFVVDYVPPMRDDQVAAVMEQIGSQFHGTPHARLPVMMIPTGWRFRIEKVPTYPSLESPNGDSGSA